MRGDRSSLTRTVSCCRYFPQHNVSDCPDMPQRDRWLADSPMRAKGQCLAKAKCRSCEPIGIGSACFISRQRCIENCLVGERSILHTDQPWHEETSHMSTRKDKRYDTSYKTKENPTQDPYAMLKVPKGPAIFRKCLAIYADKRWHFDKVEAPKLAISPRAKRLVCPACQKIRDDYPEGIVTLTWSGPREHAEENIPGVFSHRTIHSTSVVFPWSGLAGLPLCMFNEGLPRPRGARAQETILPTSHAPSELVYFPSLEGRPCWSRCGRRTGPSQGARSWSTRPTWMPVPFLQAHSRLHGVGNQTIRFGLPSRTSIFHSLIGFLM